MFFSPILQILKNDLITLRGFLIENSYLIIGWIGALISATFILIGYYIPQIRGNFSIEKKCNLNYYQIWNYGFLVNIIGFLLYSISSGFDFSIFNIFSSDRSSIEFLSYKGEFYNYFKFTINFLITGTLLTTIAAFKIKKKVFLSFFIFILTSLIFF